MAKKNDIAYVLRKEILGKDGVCVQRCGVYKCADKVVEDIFKNPEDNLETLASRIVRSNLDWGLGFKMPDDFPEVEVDKWGAITSYKEISQQEQADFLKMLAGCYVRPPVMRSQ